MKRKYYYQSILMDEFNLRKTRNQRFSLRAYAKFLDINPATLSNVLRDKRCFPINLAHQVTTKLKLSEQEKSLFVDSIIACRKEKSSEIARRKEILSLRRKLLREHEAQLKGDKYYEVITQWEYYGVLSLMKVDGFIFSLENISKSLGFSTERSNEIVGNLYSLGLIKKDDMGKVTRTYNSLFTTEEIPSHSLKIAHINELELAKEKVYTVPVNKRHFSSVTMAINSNKILEAGKIIKEFKDKISGVLEGDSKDSVYNLTVNLFPLTENEVL